MFPIRIHAATTPDKGCRNTPCENNNIRGAAPHPLFFPAKSLDRRPAAVI